LLLAWAWTGCAYLNTFYNAEQAYQEGIRLSGGESDSLSGPARNAFERAAEKSAIVLDRHSDSEYADDALLLLAQSFYQLGRHRDAATVFREYITRFPDSDEAGLARLGLVRSQRRLGDLGAAEAALGGLLGNAAPGIAEAEILYEKALIELGLGAHNRAVETFRQLLEQDPQFAREHNLILQFADAQLSAGQYDAALEAYAAYRDNAADLGAQRQAALKIAHALGLAGHRDEALATYAEIIELGVPDSMAAIAEVERGDLFAADSAWDDAEASYRRTAELAPGTIAASRATLHRGRIVWRVRRQHEDALDVLLDAFLHSPTSAFGDSARTESRALARLIHYQQLASGREVVAGIEDAAVARSTALYRLGEETLDVESDPDRAAAIFTQLSTEYPDSPWRPRAMLAAGLLRFRNGLLGTGSANLRSLITEFPDTPEADSARRELGFEVPERPMDFYAVAPELTTLTTALPDVADPMVRIVDQLDRYARRDDQRRDEVRNRRTRPTLAEPTDGAERPGPLGGAPPGQVDPDDPRPTPPRDIPE
jgi:TolA-binding protein